MYKRTEAIPMSSETAQVAQRFGSQLEAMNNEAKHPITAKQLVDRHLNNMFQTLAEWVTRTHADTAHFTTQSCAQLAANVQNVLNNTADEEELDDSEIDEQAVDELLLEVEQAVKDNNPAAAMAVLGKVADFLKELKAPDDEEDEEEDEEDPDNVVIE